MAGEKNDFPFVTPERVHAVCLRDRELWYAALPKDAPHPRLGFAGRADLEAVTAQIRAATDKETKKRRDDLRRAADEIMDVAWLRVYDHHPERRKRNAPLIGFPVPTYRTPDELTGGTLIREDANRELWQRDMGDCLPALALAAHLFPDRADDYKKRMKAFVLAALEFPTWGATPHLNDMDLACDHLARGLAVAYDWHPDLWNAEEKARLFAVLGQKVGTLLRGAYGAAFWARGWTDNHCQNAFATLGICGACFLGEIPEADQWLGAAVAGFDIALPLCNRDGSSAEGVPYWSYGMTFLLQYIEWTQAITGANALYDYPYLKNAASYRLHCSLPDLSGTVTFGDANQQDYYGPSHLLYALARQYQDGAAQWFGDSIPFANRSGADVETCALLWRDPTLLSAAPAEVPLDYHLPDWDVATTRSGWKANDYVLAVKSGFNSRSHSHLDAGTLLFGGGDAWLIDAPGYGRVGPGFWDRGGPRWEYYSNSTESHSTLLINGKNQRFDSSARGTITQFETTGETCRIVVDLTAAYHDVLRIRRSVFHRRGHYILVQDEIDFAADLPGENRVEWLLQPGKTAAVDWSETSPDLVVLKGAGALHVQALVPPNADPPVFRPRAPRSPHLDVPPETVRTLALSAQGSPSAAFAVLIIPGDAPEITAHIASWEPNQRRVIVAGAGFQDIIS